MGLTAWLILFCWQHDKQNKY